MLRLTDYSLLFLLLVSTSCFHGAGNLETLNTDVSKNDKEQVGALISDQEDLVGVFSLETNNGIFTHKDIFPNDKPVLLFLALSIEVLVVPKFGTLYNSSPSFLKEHMITWSALTRPNH